MIPPSTIAQAKAELCGLIATVAVQRDEGGKLAMRLRSAFDRVEAIVDGLAAEAAGPLPVKVDLPKPVVNGTPLRPTTTPAPGPVQPQRGSSNVGSQQK